MDKLSGGNSSAFGRLLGYGSGAFVRQMLRGRRSISDKTLRQIEALRGMQGWFSDPPAATGVHEPAAIRERGPGPQYHKVYPSNLGLKPGLKGYTVHAGDGDEDAPITFHRNWLIRRGCHSADLLALRVRDVGMEPGLHAGDMVVIDTADTEPRDGQVFVVNYEGQAQLRRLLRDAGHWWLALDHPDQARFARKEFAEPECFLVGRVVFRQTEYV
ncbi:S24 family peptidase [Ramlibacter sp. H39-3-26]|uniref:S24 family peptidase n=1 Tax=Curvibacter soli TaxID=3031331 RepID=UPI0023DCE7E6|nr:S24 family peptidase [Ramlibacter sp. H39-3-26]MDF1485960.1 S24 family peptidase [Ramlibacter sp. H39-3-26]